MFFVMWKCKKIQQITTLVSDHTLVLLKYTAVIFVLSCTVKIYVLHTYTETELTWFTIMIYKQIVVCRLLSLEVKWSGRCWILLQNLLHCSLVSWKIHYCVNFCYLFSCLTWWLTLITDNKVWMFMVQVLQLHMVAALMERYGWWVVLLPTRGEWKCV